MTTPDTRPPTAGEDEIDLLDLLAGLWAGKIWIIGAIALALAAGAFSVLRVEPLYQAQGLLQLEAKAGSLALPEGMQDLLGGGSAKSPSETEMEIMKSRMVMGEAVQTLNLQVAAYPRPMPVLGRLPKRLGLQDTGLEVFRPYQWGNEAIAVGELEVASPWLGAELVLTITGNQTYALRLPDGTQIEGRARARLASPDNRLSIVVDRLEGPVGREFIVVRQNLVEAIRRLQVNFAVTETPRGSSILRVTYVDPSPRQAERVLDAITQAHLALCRRGAEQPDLHRGTAAHCRKVGQHGAERVECLPPRAAIGGCRIRNANLAGTRNTG